MAAVVVMGNSFSVPSPWTTFRVMSLVSASSAEERLLSETAWLLSTAEELVSVWEELSSTWEEVLAGVLLSWEAEEPLASPQPAGENGQQQGKAQQERGAPRRKRLVCFMCVTSFLKRLDLRDGAQPFTALAQAVEKAGRKTKPGIGRPLPVPCAKNPWLWYGPFRASRPA